MHKIYICVITSIIYEPKLKAFIKNLCKPLLGVAFFFMPVLSASSQTTDTCQYQVSGVIYDLSNKQPLAFASIQIKGTNIGTIADEKGNFVIKNLCDKEFDLIFSHVGFKQLTHHHDPHHELSQVFLAPERVSLESVIIEGEALEGGLNSNTIDKLSEGVFEENKTESLGDLAARITGVSVLKTGQNIAKPIIHGLHSNRVLVINNGVRHEFQNWGQEHAPEIDPSLAEDISVIKGAATVRFGPDALGGVLLINPPEMEMVSPLSGELNLVGKSNGRSGEGSFKLQKGYEQVAFLASGSFVRQGDLKAPDYFLTNTGKTEKSLSLGAKYHSSHFDLTGSYSHFDQELGILRGSVTGNLNDLAQAMESDIPQNTRDFSYDINTPKQRVIHDLFKLSGELHKENQSFLVQYGFQINQRREFDVRRGTNNERPAINLELFSHSLDVEWNHPEWNLWQGSIGIQGVYQDNNNLPGTNTIPFIPNYNNTRLGIYMIESRTFDKNTFEWGLRYDFQGFSVRGRAANNDLFTDDLTYQNLSATVGMKRDIKEGHVIRTNIGSAWRPPNVSELYSFGRNQSIFEYGLWRYEIDENNEVTANRVLTEQDREVPSEVGLKWVTSYEISQKKWQTDLTGYVNLIYNYIFTKPAGVTQNVRGALPFFIYDQTDALLLGMDFSGSYRHNEKLNSSFNASILWAKDVGNNENFVGLPPINLGYVLEYLPARDFGIFLNNHLNLNLKYTFEQFQAPRHIGVDDLLEAKANDIDLFEMNDEVFDFLPPPSGYFLVDASWGFQVKNIPGLHGSLQIKNVLNQSYRNYTDFMRYVADDMGRNFILSVRYKF